MRTYLTAALTAALLAVPASAQADMAECPSKLESSYTHSYNKVRHRLGHRAPGRQIRRHGVRFKGVTFVATCPELRRSRKQLDRLLKRWPYLQVSAVRPLRPPAGVKTASLAPTGLAACIVWAESTNNHLAVNGEHTGIAQWSPEAWARHGGHRFAQTPLGATRDQQLVILNQGLSVYGCIDWCPYDGC